MRPSRILVAILLSCALTAACGDDDDSSSDRDGGVDGSAGDSAGSGGRGGSGGPSAGSAGAGKSGAGGSNGAGEGDGDKYAIAGSVTGLTGSGLVLRNNGGDDLEVAADGDFELATRVATGDDYNVTVATQPTNPTERCLVANGAGKVGTEDVRDVAVTCSEVKQYKLRGTIENLSGSGLVLKNGTETLNASGTTFEFTTAIDSDADYAVTVDAQPSDQVCSVENASGKIAAADVTDIVVKCHPKSTLEVAPSVGSAIATWADVGASSYTIKLTTSPTCDLEGTSCPGYAELTNVSSPTTIRKLTNGTPYYFQLTANYSGGVSGLSNKIGVRPNRALLNGDVKALAAGANGVTYAGGAFTSVDVYTGSIVPLNKKTGIANVNPGFAIIEGITTAIAADGSGGHYIGGAASSDSVNLQPFLAHIKADGQLDSAWHPILTTSIPTGVSIAVHNDIIYAYGGFSGVISVGSGGLPQQVSRSGIAAFRADGTLVEGFNPAVAVSGRINAIAFIGDDVLVGGSFTSVGGGTQANLALLDAQTGAAKTWDAGANDSVSALVVDSDKVYVLGAFTMIGGQARSGLAALQASGDSAAQATDWNPAPSGSVGAIAVANDTVYIGGGTFTAVGSTERARIAAIDAASGAVKEWNPVIPPGGGGVSVLKVFEDTVYIGGDFTQVSGVSRNGAAAVSVNGAGTLTDWNPKLGPGYPIAFELTGDAIIAGGVFFSAGGAERRGLAAFEGTGELTDWNPGANGDVLALAAADDRIYVGGAFTSLGGVTRNRIGAVSANGVVDGNFDPNADANVLALSLTSSTLYAGGSFANIGTQSRASIAALDAATGAASSWNPGSNNSVRAISIQGNTLYAGGDFTQLGRAGDPNTPTSALRNGLAAVPLDSNFATAWNPDVTLGTGVFVAALATTADTVYAGGNFATVGGIARLDLAAIDATTGIPTSFAPAPSGRVVALAVDGSALYVGGDFTNIASTTAARYAVFDNGILRANPITRFDAQINALLVRGDSVYVGAAVQSLGASAPSNFVKLPK